MNYIRNVSPFYVSKEEWDKFTIKSHTECSWFNLEAQMFQYLSCKKFRPEEEPDTQKLICMKYKYPADMPSATIINGNVYMCFFTLPFQQKESAISFRL